MSWRFLKCVRGLHRSKAHLSPCTQAEGATASWRHEHNGMSSKLTSCTCRSQLVQVSGAKVWCGCRGDPPAKQPCCCSHPSKSRSTCSSDCAFCTLSSPPLPGRQMVCDNVKTFSQYHMCKACATHPDASSPRLPRPNCMRCTPRICYPCWIQVQVVLGWMKTDAMMLRILTALQADRLHWPQASWAPHWLCSMPVSCVQNSVSTGCSVGLTYLHGQSTHHRLLRRRQGVKTACSRYSRITSGNDLQ